MTSNITTISNIIYMSPSIAPGMSLDIFFAGKHNNLTNAINIEGVQPMNNTILT